MIKIVEGNILNATEDIIGHQVNCQGVMGAGLAKQIKAKYSDVYKEYSMYCDSHKRDRQQLMGQCYIIETDDNKYIANLFGQLDYGRNERQTNYVALELALKKLKDIAYEHNKSVALPYGIGCGLAGGNWSIAYGLIQYIFEDYEVTLYKLK